MNAAHKPGVSEPTIWLELRVDGRYCKFEFSADEMRAVVVGSLPRADLQIDRPGVAPVHFHVERESNALWVVPAYGANDLRVDTARARGPRRISERAVIEFCDIRIEAQVQRGTQRQTSPAQAFAERELETLNHASTAPFTVREMLPTVPINRFVRLKIRQEGQATTCAGLGSPTVRATVSRSAAIEPVPVIPLEHVVETLPTALRPGAVPERAYPANSLIVGVANRVGPPDTIRMSPFWLEERAPSVEVPVNAANSRQMAQATPLTVAISPEAQEMLVAPSAAAMSVVNCCAPTLVEPIRSSNAAFPIVQGVLAQTTAALDSSMVSDAQNRALRWLLVGGVGSIASLVFAGALVVTVRHGVRSEPRQTKPPDAAVAAATASEGTPMHGPRPIEPLLIIPSVPPAAANNAKKGQPSNPELLAAVGHLVSGRLPDAQRAYWALAVQFPHDPALLALARLLERRSRPACSSSAANNYTGCPEVKQ